VAAHWVVEREAHSGSHPIGSPFRPRVCPDRTVGLCGSGWGRLAGTVHPTTPTPPSGRYRWDEAIVSIRYGKIRCFFGGGRSSFRHLPSFGVGCLGLERDPPPPTGSHRSPLEPGRVGTGTMGCGDETRFRIPWSQEGSPYSFPSLPPVRFERVVDERSSRRIEHVDRNTHKHNRRHADLRQNTYVIGEERETSEEMERNDTRGKKEKEGKRGHGKAWANLGGDKD